MTHSAALDLGRCEKVKRFSIIEHRSILSRRAFRYMLVLDGFTIDSNVWNEICLFLQYVNTDYLLTAVDTHVP